MKSAVFLTTRVGVKRLSSRKYWTIKRPGDDKDTGEDPGKEFR